MSLPLPNHYLSVPQAPASVIPGSTRLVLIGGEQETLLEVQIPPQSTILQLLCDRYMSEIAPEIDRKRLRLLIGRDSRGRRREQGAQLADDGAVAHQVLHRCFAALLRSAARMLARALAAAGDLGHQPV